MSTTATDIASASGGAAVCPECGWSVGVPVRPRGSRVLRLGAIARYGILIVALVVLGYKNYQSANTNKSVLSGGPSFEPVDPPVSFGQLRAIADGQEDGAGLAEAVHRFRPRGFLSWPTWRWRLHSVAATFRPRSGEVSETKNWGWPGQWWSEYAVTQYEDVFARSGPVARDWGSRRSGGGGAAAASSGALTVRDVRSNFLYREVLVSVLVWLVGSWVIASLVLLASKARTPTVPSYRVRVCVWGAVLAVTGGLIIVLALSTRRETVRVDCQMLTESGAWGRFGWESERVELPYKLRDLATVGDIRGLAREITSGIQDEVPDDAVLHLGAVPSSTSSDEFTDIGWPELMISTWSCEVQPLRPGDTVGVPSLDVDVSWSPHLFRSSLPSIIWYSRDRGTGSIHGRNFAVYAFNAAPIALMIGAFWILTGTALRVGSRCVVRRRLRDQCCVACGYSLAGLRRADAP